MPAMKYFEVEETRVVRVRAETPAHAVHLADATFKGQAPDPQIEGGVVSETKTTNVSARED